MRNARMKRDFERSLSGLLLVSWLAAAAPGCDAADDSPPVLERDPSLALECVVTRQAEMAPDAYGARYVAVAATASTGWCLYEASGPPTLHAIDGAGALGPEVVLDPSHAPNLDTILTPAGDQLAVLFEVYTAPAVIEARFTLVDADGRLAFPPVPVPRGKLVAFTGTFGLLSLEAGADSLHPTLVLRVLDGHGAVVVGPVVLLTVTVPRYSDHAPFSEGRVTVTPAPNGFIVRWRDDAGSRLARFDATGKVVLGPLTLVGDALGLGDGLWTSWVETTYSNPTPTEHSYQSTLWVAAVDAAGAVTQAPVATYDRYLADPMLFAAHGYAMLSWSQGRVGPGSSDCSTCGARYEVHLVALTRDDSGAIVPASDEVVLTEDGAGLSLVGVAPFGDDLLLAMTAAGHAWWRPALASVRCSVASTSAPALR